MSGKLSQYTTTATGIAPTDWLDVSIDNGDGTFTSAKLPGSVLLALITGGVNLGTGDLTQTDLNRFYDGLGAGSKLEFAKMDDFVVRATRAKFTADVDVDYNLEIAQNTTFNQAIIELGIQTINSSPTTGNYERSGWAVDTSAGAITINLPSAAVLPGQKIYIFDYNGNSAVNPITLDGDGAETINGQLTQVINTNYGWCIIYSDGSNWRMLRPDLNGNGAGWASYEDGAYLATTVANTPLQLTFGKPIALESHIPEGVATYWETTGHTIPGRLNDGISLQFTFSAEPLDNNLYLDVWLDLGGSIGIIYPQTITFPRGSGVVRKVVYNLSSLYQLSTWVANGAKIYVESNGAVEITKPKLNVHRNYKG
jgi:hypothetical protein